MLSATLICFAPQVFRYAGFSYANFFKRPLPMIYKVHQLTKLIKGLLEQEFTPVMVQGELSSIATPYSGHVYFTLKDNQSQIASVCFKGQASRLKFDLEEGLEVIGKPYPG